MTIYNLGSINLDHLYKVAHLPQPGETLVATDFSIGLGGKGANQSIAAARAGSRVVHIGAVGSDGGWAKEQMREYGVDVSFVKTVKTATGHAIINLDQSGENAIVIFPGANNKQDISQIREALKTARPDDILLLQNETILQSEAANIALKCGMKVIYSAAPFSVGAVGKMLPVTSILMMNMLESQQLCAGLGLKLQSLPVENIIVTKGANGADWHSVKSREIGHQPAFAVPVADTTAAGDTFAGYFAAGLDQGMDIMGAMQLGASAAALKVMRSGTASAIPARAQVDEFLKANPL